MTAARRPMVAAFVAAAPAVNAARRGRILPLAQATVASDPDGRRGALDELFDT